MLRLQGKDVTSFLQGIFTADMNDMQDGKAMFSALLTPQGKLAHDFFLLRNDEAIYLDVAKTHVEALQKKLKIYKMRADVSIEDVSEEYSIHFGDQLANGAYLCNDDTRVQGKRMVRCVVPKSEDDDSAKYHAWRISEALPEAAEDGTDRTFLLDLGYDVLGAVDFGKGCYVGQEVTARMHYKKARKRTPYRLHCKEPIKEAGEITTSEGMKLGDLRSFMGQDGIAVCQWEAVEKAKGHGIMLGDQAVTLHVPEWFAAQYQTITQAEASA